MAYIGKALSTYVKSSSGGFANARQINGGAYAKSFRPRLRLNAAGKALIFGALAIDSYRLAKHLNKKYKIFGYKKKNNSENIQNNAKKKWITVNGRHIPVTNGKANFNYKMKKKK